MKTIPWPGYPEGAIRADDPDIACVFRKPDGNLYVTTMTGEVFNVHPKVTEAGWDETYIDEPNGVFPVRWELDSFEIDRL